MITGFLGRVLWVYIHETHHRIRNNLQLIISLLRLQEDSLVSDDGKNAIRESKNRIFAMALIEDKLYDAGNLDKEAFSCFLAEYESFMTEQIGAERFTLETSITVTDSLFNSSYAIPLGLIINELVQNACLYGPDSEGKIRVMLSLDADSQGKRILKVRDYGPEFPPGFRTDKDGKLGFLLIDTLVRQIQGSLEVYSDQGAVVRIVF
ncbi:MAG: sensor histidine kinase [Treponema sp.]|nr:sensor histidine kinase [Treponema sp.]